MINRIAAVNQRVAMRWRNVSPNWLPFADAASEHLPFSRLMRLALFQVSVGMATALLVGTLNRVMIVELGVAAWLVAAAVALPVLSAPFRALIGYSSDNHRSVLGWRRVPYIWSGSIMQFGGLAIMPFTLILLQNGSHAAPWIGQTFGALAFILVGAGLQITQTAGLALATDLAEPKSRPRVVALMYVMLLLGMIGSGLVFGLALTNFSNTRLVQVVQGSAVLTVVFNLIASWKQEPRRRNQPVTKPVSKKENLQNFRSAWKSLVQSGQNKRFLVAIGLGSAAFAMQDIILEPYGGEILGLSVSATTLLTAVMAAGALIAYGLAARLLSKGFNPHRLAACGLLIGLPAFSMVIFAEPLGSTMLFRVGVALIGFGAGLFSVSTLIAAMNIDIKTKDNSTDQNMNGLALGAWGSVQATCTGIAMLLGGGLRDVVSQLATSGVLGEVLSMPATGYSFVYHFELFLLFAALVAIGPLVRNQHCAANHLEANNRSKASGKFGLSELPT